MIQSYTLLGMLGWCSIEDWRRKRVLVYPVLLFGIFGVLLHIYYQNVSIYSLLAGCGIGLLLLFLSAVSRQLGSGDGLVLMVSGIYLGFWDNIRLLFLGLLLCGLWSVVLLVSRKKKASDKIAFIPFLFLAYVRMVLF